MSEAPLQFLSTDDWQLLSASASHLNFKPGEEIIREGSKQKIIYVLRRGTVLVEMTQSGRKVQIARLGPGEMFGEMAFLEDSDASASAKAENHVDVEAIAGPQLYQLFESFPGLTIRFYQSISLTLSKRLRHVTAQLVDILPPEATAGKD